MNRTANPPADPPTAKPGQLHFHWILLAIAGASLIPRLLLGFSESVTYDGYWHVFTATQDYWANMVLDYKSDAHPILYYVLLRWAAHLGNVPIIYRSVSILPGIGAAVVIGNIAKKVCLHGAVALLAAAAYAFAITSIALSIDVRSYMGCLFFVLLSFSYFLDGLALPENGRAWVFFGLFASLAIGFEYYAAFYLSACFALLGLAILFDPAYRKDFLHWARINWLSFAAALAFPLLTIRYFYRSHLSRLPNTFTHLNAYYWDPSAGELRGQFLLKNLQSTFNYFLPVEIANRWILLAILVLFFALLLAFSFRSVTQRFALRLRVIALMPVLLLLELMMLALARRYPFGGEMRQMSILAPFLCLCLFVLIDELISLMQPRLRMFAVSGVAVAVMCSAYVQWMTYVRYPQVLFTEDYQRFIAAVPAPEAVYLDQFSLVAYYIHTHNWAWHSDHRLRFDEKSQEYRTASPRGQQIVILRDRENWNLDFNKAASYQLLAQLMRDHHKRSLSVFHLQQFGAPLPTVPLRRLPQTEFVATLAAQAGLKLASLDVQDRDLFATFVID